MSNIAYAPESGSERTRKLIKKKMSTSALLKSIESSISNNLNVSLFYVLGFPHDTAEDMVECLNFVKKARRLGVSDLPVGFFFAIPGTQLFDTLYDEGKIQIDKKYFTHILQGSELLPTRTYCRELPPIKLAYWRYKIWFTFYGTSAGKTSSNKAGGPLFQVLKGFFSRNHSSRLQTAIRSGTKNFLAMLSTYFRPRWVSREEEKIFFDDWDRIYADIRKQKMDCDSLTALPADTELFSLNVIEKVQFEHKKSTSLKVLA
jgi:radical SAM superfamily enzyme YgiQ (UPF0313 family)